MRVWNKGNRKSRQKAVKLAAIANWTVSAVTMVTVLLRDEHRLLVTFKVGAGQSFSENVGSVFGGIDVSDIDVPTVDKLADFEVATFNMTRAHTGLRVLYESDGRRIVDVEDGGSGEKNAHLAKQTTLVYDFRSGARSGHHFSLCGRE